MSQTLKLPVHIYELLESDDVQSFAVLCKKKGRVFGGERMNFLHLAAKYSPGLEVAKYCVHTLKIKSSIKTGKSKSTPLHYAAARGNFDLVNYLIDLPSTILDAPRKGGATPFLAAVKHNHTEIALTLLARGACIKAVDKRRWNAAHWACRNGNFDLFKVLVHRGASFYQETAMNENCLHLSAWSGNLELVQSLFDKFPLPHSTARGSFFMYMKGNWSVLHWVLSATPWATMNKLTLLLHIEAPMELIRLHCANELNTMSCIVYDRVDLINFQIRQGVRVLECMREFSNSLRPQCAQLYRRLARFECFAGVAFVRFHGHSDCLIRKLRGNLFQELLKYFIVL